MSTTPSETDDRTRRKTKICRDESKRRELSNSSGVGSRRQKKLDNSEVIHPIFFSCALETDDPYWQDIFKNASKGLFPKNFRYFNRNLIYSGLQRKQINVSENVSEAYSECLSFFKIQAGLYSETDNDNNSSMSIGEYIKWSDIKSDKVKKYLINSYISECIENYNMDPDQAKTFRTEVNMAFLFEHLTKDNIIYENGQITNITNLSYDIDKHKVQISHNKKTKEKFATEDSFETFNPNLQTNTLIQKAWLKFLLNFKKSCQSKSIHTQIHSDLLEDS